jgi:hypothetical protein
MLAESCIKWKTALAQVFYAIIDKGIIGGTNSIFDIGKDWMGKLFKF